MIDFNDHNYRSIPSYRVLNNCSLVGIRMIQIILSLVTKRISKDN